MASHHEAGRRLSWQQVPSHVRSAVEATLGAAVVEVRTQEGGFSPGAAARVRLANGATAFVKALSVDLHPNSVGLYRTEAATMPHLPAGLPVPRLLDVYDDGNWVALVYDEVDGRHPDLPWQTDELARVSAALTDLGAALQPSPWPGAPSFVEANRGFLGAWAALAASPPPGLEPWMRRHLDRVAAEVPDLAEVMRGDALLHNDIRSDNLLLTPEGDVIVIDWGGTCNGGAPWLDFMFFALTVNEDGGADTDVLVRDHPLMRDVPPSWIDAILMAAVATRWRQAQLAEDPTMPGAHAYQRRSADAALSWVRRRAEA
jgi:aminoglycoside phosphotransferase (APT) family kinase protein